MPECTSLGGASEVELSIGNYKEMLNELRGHLSETRRGGAPMLSAVFTSADISLTLSPESTSAAARCNSLNFTTALRKSVHAKTNAPPSAQVTPSLSQKMTSTTVLPPDYVSAQIPIASQRPRDPSGHLFVLLLEERVLRVADTVRAELARGRARLGNGRPGGIFDGAKQAPGLGGCRQIGVSGVRARELEGSEDAMNRGENCRGNGRQLCLCHVVGQTQKVGQLVNRDTSRSVW